MPSTVTTRRQPRADRRTPASDTVASSLAWLERRGTKRNRDGMARYAIHADHVFGVAMTDIRTLAGQLGRDHALAAALWDSGWYEARLLAAFVDEPAKVTPSQMDRWARDFDNWAVCDTVCMHLFDRTPHAFRKVTHWSGRKPEFVRRAAFALLASLALHDKDAADEPFVDRLTLIERGATDDRNFVKKAVSWALRAIGQRNQRLHTRALRLSERLAASPVTTPRWIGKDALRDLTSPAALRRVARRGNS
jgi:3-methyladenine DNA glycosylase AlkD